MGEQILHLQSHPKALESALGEIKEKRTLTRLYEGDPYLWTDDQAAHAEIRNRLGWLTVVPKMRAKVDLLNRFHENVARKGFTDAVVLGMGGSSLCPDVLRRTFGKQKNDLELHVLDSTDPMQVLHLSDRLKDRKPLFIVASKSGTTVEPNSFYDYFRKLYPEPENFVAITDDGTKLHRLAQEEGFLHCFVNPSDIGGRFSALSLFGLVPAALLGLDLNAFLTKASEMACKCANQKELEKNPGAVLGTLLGCFSRDGREKLTIVGSEKLEPLGDWIEQLVAESTGKESKGILPIIGEKGLKPEATSDDRVFLYYKLAGEKDGFDAPAFEKNGHPVIEIQISDFNDLAGEFFRWEIATSVAGAVLRINPFDQPNVQESKMLAKKMLQQESSAPDTEIPTIADFHSLESFLDGVLKKNGFIALLAYLPQFSEIEARLQSLREKLLQRFKVPTTLGFGPRYLHSTGQYHKGGPNNGAYVFFTCDEDDLKIPGQNYGFSKLKTAQAFGDMSALENGQRQVIRIHLTQPLAESLNRWV